MAISTFAELQTAIANWTGRADLASGTRVEEIIALSEARIYQDAAKRGEIIGMEKSASVTITAGVETATVPSDYIRALLFRLDTNTEIEPQSLSQLILSGDAQDKPRFYSTTGGSSPLFRMRPVPDANYTATLVYVAKFPALTSSNTTNWLLTNAPNAYLYAAILEAAALYRDQESAQGATMLFDTAMSGLCALTSKYRFSSPPIKSLDRSLSSRLRERLF